VERRAILSVVTIVLITLTSGCGPGTSNVPATDIVKLINEKRTAAGCNEVTGNDQLRVAAEKQAVDIRDHPDWFGTPGTNPPKHDIHTGTDSSTGGTRIAAAGYSPLSLWGEIIYWAPGPPGNTAQASVDWWMNSPPHRAQIETCDYTNIGVGLLYPGGTQWIAVVDFGKH